MDIQSVDFRDAEPLVVLSFFFFLVCMSTMVLLFAGLFVFSFVPLSAPLTDEF